MKPTTWIFRTFVATFIMMLLSALCVNSDPPPPLPEEQERLFAAVKTDNVQAVKEALEEDGVNINTQNARSGQTPLMHAILLGKETVAKYLLELGTDLTIGERQGYVPIDGAGFQGRATIAKLLIEKHGMDPSYFHKDGFTPFHRACWGREERHTETVRVFLDHGVPPNLKSVDGKEPLEMTKNPATMELLTQRLTENIDQDSGDGEKSNEEL